MLPGLGGAIAAAGSATPTLRGTVQTSSQTSGGTFAVTIPTHAAGDVLVALCNYKNLVAVTPSAGWTEAVQLANSGGGPPNDGGIVAYYRTATGSAHTLTITNSNGNNIVGHAYVLVGAQGAVSATAANGIDPPSHTPSWGAGPSFWIAANGANQPNAPTGGPTGFGNSVQTISGATNAALSTLDKADSSATLDPSAFTGPGMAAVAQSSITLAVRPL